MPCPEAGAARELKNVSLGERRLKCRFSNSDLTKPFLTMGLTAVVATLPQEPLVVLSGSSAIVIPLFDNERIVLH